MTNWIQDLIVHIVGVITGFASILLSLALFYPVWRQTFYIPPPADPTIYTITPTVISSLILFASGFIGPLVVSIVLGIIGLAYEAIDGTPGERWVNGD